MCCRLDTLRTSCAFETVKLCVPLPYRFCFVSQVLLEQPPRYGGGYNASVNVVHELRPVRSMSILHREFRKLPTGLCRTVEVPHSLLIFV